MAEPGIGVLARRLVVLLMLLAPGIACAGSAVQLTDDRGVVVRLAQPPQRIVSLLPSLTESVCELGQCRRLVGVDRYSDYPPPVRSLPRLGGGLDPNIEAVVALRPDVVLMAASSRAVQRLESLGIKVITLEPRSYADVRRVLGQLAALLEVPDAPRFWRAIDAGVDAAAQSLPPEARHMRVYFEVGRGPYAASEASFIGETLTRLGVKNIVPGELGPFPKINPEFVVRADPDLIMIGEAQAPELALRPGWSRMRAVRDQRLCLFSPQESDVLVRPGPRMAQAARLMARCIAGVGLAAKR
jgi:iron complex transport system substrate-binding protein